MRGALVGAPESKGELKKNTSKIQIEAILLRYFNKYKFMQKKKIHDEQNGQLLIIEPRGCNEGRAGRRSLGACKWARLGLVFIKRFDILFMVCWSW